MSTDRLQYLLERLFHHRLTEGEKEELALWSDTLQNEEEWKERLSRIWNSYQPVDKMNPEHADEILKSILSKRKDIHAQNNTPSSYSPVRSGMMRWAVAAAAVIGILIISSLIFLNPRRELTENQPEHPEITQKKKIVPGSNKAVLILANGQKINLDSSKSGSLVQQGNTQIIKVGSGLLSYNNPLKTQNPHLTIEYNTLATPRGGQYQVILPDGSKIWLNSASSIQFPTAFTRPERSVTVKGEVYLEVTKEEQKPFVVHILSPDGEDKGRVKVLGTGFNINAYSSKITTTLISGAIVAALPSVSEQSGVRLRPGEQAEIQDNDIKTLKNVNLEEIMAWKKGLFNFEGNDIEEVMHQIAVWYDVDVKYKTAPSAHFMGTISRDVPVSEVLKMLEMTGAVHFRIEGRTVVVMK